MQKTQNLEKLYDGRNSCHTSNCCPVAEKHGDKVIIFDPAKPQKGKFEFTVNEYNSFLKGAKSAR